MESLARIVCLASLCIGRSLAVIQVGSDSPLEHTLLEKGRQVENDTDVGNETPAENETQMAERLIQDLTHLTRNRPHAHDQEKANLRQKLTQQSRDFRLERTHTSKELKDLKHRLHHLPKQDKEHLKRELKDAKHQFLQEKAQKKKALEQDIENLTSQFREEQHPLQELENATRQLLHQRTQEKALFHYELQNMTRHLHHEQLRKKAEMHEELKNQSMHLKQEMRYLRKKLKNESREYHRERAQEKELVRQKLENQSEGFEHKKELLQEELEYLKWHARYGRERADEEKRLREEVQKETKQLLQERNHVKMTRSELESLEEEDDNKTFGSNSSTTNGRQVNAAAGFSTSMGVLERLSVLVASMLGWATVAIIIITDGRGLSRRFCTTSSGDGAEPLLALEARP